MTDRCAPPDGSPSGEYWVEFENRTKIVLRWRHDLAAWWFMGAWRTPDEIHFTAVRYLRPCRPDDAEARERFSGPYGLTGLRPSFWHPGTPIWYWADGNPPEGDWTKPKPGIHMPRWASRITLLVTDVRVERVQDISEEDAIAEGIEDVTRQITPNDPSLRFWRRYRDGSGVGYVDSAIGSYASLWTSINGPGSWNANPWVAALSFERVET